MSVFLPNVYVDGIALSGLTWQEGSQKVWEQANAKENSWYVRLKNSSGQYQDITASMLGFLRPLCGAGRSVGHRPRHGRQRKEGHFRAAAGHRRGEKHHLFFTSAHKRQYRPLTRS